MSMSASSTQITHVRTQRPLSIPNATVSQTSCSQTIAATENATDANWSIPSEPTRRMPVGERRRRTMRKTATVGTPIERIQRMLAVHTELKRPSSIEKNETTNAISHTPTRATSRIENGPTPY